MCLSSSHKGLIENLSDLTKFQCVIPKSLLNSESLNCRPAGCCLVVGGSKGAGVWDRVAILAQGDLKPHLLILVLFLPQFQAKMQHINKRLSLIKMIFTAHS